MNRDWEWFRRFTKQCKGTGGFDALRKLYGEIPGTTCARCGECCFESPCISFVEFAYICDMIRRRHLEKKHPNLLHAILGYVWKDLILEGTYCPFLSERECVIYDFRPFHCRIWGLRSPEDVDESRQRAGEYMEAMQKQYATMGISIPDQKVNKRIANCTR